MERVILQIEHFVPDKSSPVPLHLQLSKMLLRQLRNVPTSGDCRLPSERSVVAEFNIDRTTVHRAYRDLLDRGLVYRNPDKSLSVKKECPQEIAWTLSDDRSDHPGTVFLFYCRGIR